MSHDETDPVEGTTRGGVKGAAKGAFGGFAGVTLVGAGLGLLAGLVLFNIVTFPATAIALSLGALFKGAVILGLTVAGGAAAASFLGIPAALLGGSAGGVIGGVNGNSKAHAHAHQRAMAMDNQIDAMQMGGMNYGYPPQGAPMNPCSCTIQATGCQRDGVVADNMALARA